ncbi:MAG: hypothetical protein IT244_04475 [Bacteroidia bacterium]|nr:hypothetical protein [Bacteroidia bacterium]
MREINYPENFSGINYIIYIGNDWDYENKTVPSTWLQLKNLKGILLGNMTFELSVFDDIRRYRPDLVLCNIYDSHCKFTTDSISEIHNDCIKIKFKPNYRIPGNIALEEIAWKNTWTQKDSSFVFNYFTKLKDTSFTGYVSSDYYIKDSATFQNAATKWLHINELLLNPPVWLLDSFICQNFDRTKLQIQFLQKLELENAIPHFQYCADKLVQHYYDYFLKYSDYIDHVDEIHGAEFSLFKTYAEKKLLSEKAIVLLNQWTVLRDEKAKQLNHK